MDTDRQIKARDLIANGAPPEIFSFIADCIDDGSLSALVAVQLLYEDMRVLTSGMELTGKAGRFCVRFFGSQNMEACSSSRDVRQKLTVYALNVIFMHI